MRRIRWMAVGAAATAILGLGLYALGAVSQWGAGITMGAALVLAVLSLREE
jgi:hypothetical protein